MQTYLYEHRLQVDNRHQCKLLSLWKKLNDTLYAIDVLPPTPWQCKTSNRGYKAQRRSLLWFIDLLTWHCKTDKNFRQLICLINEYYHNINNSGPRLTLAESNEMQMQANLNLSQMRIIRRILRHGTNSYVLASEAKINGLQQSYHHVTGAVHAIQMDLTKTEKEKRRDQPIYKAHVYHANIFEVLQSLIDVTFNKHRFSIESPLPKNEFNVQIGWDKSDGGNTESATVGIFNKYHGKYGSLVVTLMDSKTAENYTNYRELSKHWNKSDMTNRLLRLPNVIILSKFCQHNGVVISKLIGSFIMTFDTRVQSRWKKLTY